MGWEQTALDFLSNPSQAGLEGWAGVLFLMVLGKILGNETRVAMWAVAAVIISPNPASLFVVGMMALAFKILDIIPTKAG